MWGALSDEKTNILSSGCSAPDLPTVLTEQARCFEGRMVSYVYTWGLGDEETWGQGTHFILQSLFETFLLIPSSSDLFGFSYLLRTSKVTMVESKLETFATL